LSRTGRIVESLKRIRIRHARLYGGHPGLFQKTEATCSTRRREIDAGTDARLTEMRLSVGRMSQPFCAATLLDLVVGPAGPAADRRQLDRYLNSRKAIPLN
jgi:hypothetical protein